MRCSIPWHVPAAAFDVAMRGLQQTANVDGIITTFPFKQQALALADEVAVRARQVGATNVLRREADGRWTADMFDGVGLVRAVASAGKTRAPAARLADWRRRCGQCHRLRAGRCRCSRAPRHRFELRSGEKRCRGDCSNLSSVLGATTAPGLDDISILINATTVGLAGEDELPLAATSLPGHLTVVDIVPRRDPTRLLQLAQASGCTAIAGSAMVEGQADAVLDFLWHQSEKA